MVVIRLGTRGPLKSLAPSATSSSTGCIIKTVLFKPGSINPRINLFGNSRRDSATNIQKAQSILRSSAETFASRWNFDPINEKPLTPGRFDWTPFKPTIEQRPVILEEKMDLESLPKEDAIVVGNKIINTGDAVIDQGGKSILPSCSSNISPRLINNLNLDPQSEDTKCSTSGGAQQAPKAHTQKILKQTKITDFGKVTKRRPKIFAKSSTARLLMP